MLRTLDKNHKFLKAENQIAAREKSLFCLESDKIFRHRIQNNHMHPLKSKIDGFLKLQPPQKIQNYLGF